MAPGLRSVVRGTQCAGARVRPSRVRDRPRSEYWIDGLSVLRRGLTRGIGRFGLYVLFAALGLGAVAGTMMGIRRVIELLERLVDDTGGR